MLANDSNQGKKQSEFFLVIRPHEAVAELMAECPSCGAMTSLALELAWRLNKVSCSECSMSKQLTEDDLCGFLSQLPDAMDRIERLIGD
jgi:transcription elongation factor Elf1